MEVRTEKKLVPKLRFGEFGFSWEEKKLEDIAKIERGRFSPRPRNNPIYYGGNIPFVQTSDIVHSKGKIVNYSQTLNEKGLKVSKKFSRGTILITIAANIGYAGVLEIDMACPDSLIGISCFEYLHNYFLNYLLEIEQTKMDYLAVEAAQKNINIEFLKPYKFTIPTLPEQQKIASFLSAVDKKIAQLSQKKFLLETYKKGVMQKIFTSPHSGGDAAGRGGELRFKQDDGSNYRDWEEKKLGEVANIITGKTPSTSNKRLWGGDIQFITPTDIVDDEKYQNHTKRFVTETKSLKILPINSIIYTCIASIGKMSISTKPCITNQQINSLIPFKDFDNEFIYYSLLRLTPKIKSTQASSTLPIINKTEFSLIKINVPLSKIEQQKIASFLSAIDNKIELANTQIEQTKVFKKGLLQQMFV